MAVLKSPKNTKNKLTWVHNFKKNKLKKTKNNTNLSFNLKSYKKTRSFQKLYSKTLFKNQLTLIVSQFN